MSDDEEYKKAVRQRAMEILGKEKDVTEQPPKRTRQKRVISEEQRQKLIARLAIEREKGMAVRREKKAINDAIKKQIDGDYEEKKKKYLSNLSAEKPAEKTQEKPTIKIEHQPSKEVKPLPIKEPQENKLLPAPPKPQVAPVAPAPPQPTPPPPQPIKATYFRPTMKHYNKFGGNYI
jgi:hypothetical protein